MLNPSRCLRSLAIFTFFAGAVVIGWQLPQLATIALAHSAFANAAPELSPGASAQCPASDTVPPLITCPANISVGSPNDGAVVNYPPPTVSDNCPGVTVACTPASGSLFPIGATTVTCTATDASGNTATCSFSITVNRIAFSLEDPLECTGPGSIVTSNASITNSGSVSSTVEATFLLPGGLLAVPGTCQVNVGVCAITSASSVSFGGTLAAGQTVNISFLTQVGDLVLTGTILCTSLTVTFGTGPPTVVQACTTVDCQPVGPGQPFGGITEPSDQKAGSVLIYNIYTSSASSPGAQNTRINITNTEPTRGIAAHLFFVDGSNCSVADRYICLTPNQTMTFLASELDPAITGYLVAIAVDPRSGCPISFNYLVGDLSVKFATGHFANLGAEAIPAVAGGLPFCTPNSVTTTLAFNGLSYGRIPRVLASSSIPARADGNDTLLIVNRIGGNLLTSASTLGTLFGLLFNDSEDPHSFILTGSCQLRTSLSNNAPRTSPRFEVVIPAGQTGWMKIFSPVDLGMLGCQINFNPNAASAAGAFNEGHNLHKLRFAAAASYEIPIFGPGC